MVAMMKTDTLAARSSTMAVHAAKTMATATMGMAMPSTVTTTTASAMPHIAARAASILPPCEPPHTTPARQCWRH